MRTVTFIITVNDIPVIYTLDDWVTENDIFIFQL